MTLVCNAGGAAAAGRGARGTASPKPDDDADNPGLAKFWFADWSISGSKVEAHAGHTGVKNPVVQIVDDANGAIVYTLRLAGQRWRPHVFAPGKYTVRISEPETRRERVVKGVIAARDHAGTLDVRV